MKDRVALNIIDDAERRGLLKPGGTIVEATSGNTGMRRWRWSRRCAATSASSSCPTRCRQEKVATLRAFGARVVVCPTAVEPDDPRSYYQAAQAHRATRRRTPSTRTSTTTPPTPRRTTCRPAPEIWEQTDGELDVFVAGMGTGGTICGLRHVLQGEEAGLPAGRRRSGRLALLRLREDAAASREPFSYKVEGIGEDFLPSTMNLKIVDEIVRVDDKECFLMTRELVRQEGLFVGGSSAARRSRARSSTREASKRKENILVLLPDGAHEVPVQDLQRRVDARERLPRRARSAGHRVASCCARKKQRPLVTAKKGECACARSSR